MKQYSFLQESINTDNNYEDALKIFNTLSDDEKWLVCPKRGIYVDAKKFLIYRHVIKNKGFIDLYPYNNNNKIGFVILAVSPKYRGKGITQELIKQCIKDCPKLGIKKIWWRCDSSNAASYKSALKCGFKLSSKCKGYYSLYIDIK